MFKVVGPRIKIRIENKEEKAGRFVIIDPNKHGVDSDIGVVIEIGHTAYMNMDDNKPWCKVGDRVMFQKHAGKLDPTDPSEMVRLLKDIDVIQVDTGE